MPDVLIAKELGKLVREWRTQRGFSQEAFAYHCGVHRTYMTHIERGTRGMSLEVLARIARGFGVELSDIFQALERRGVTVDRITDAPTVT